MLLMLLANRDWRRLTLHLRLTCLCLPVRKHARMARHCLLWRRQPLPAVGRLLQLRQIMMPGLLPRRECTLATVVTAAQAAAVAAVTLLHAAAAPAAAIAGASATTTASAVAAEWEVRRCGADPQLLRSTSEQVQAQVQARMGTASTTSQQA